MSVTLPASLYSVQDLKMVIIELREVTKWQTHQEVKQKVTNAEIKMTDLPDVSEAATQLIDGIHRDQPVTRTSIETLVAELEKVVQTAPQVHVTLAAVPSAGLKSDLIAWFRQHVSPQVLVTFKFNSSLLGGMVVRSGSHVFDWSFRRQILANREQFTKELRRV